MELTPRKSTLKSTPKKKGLVSMSNDTPKKVRFSVRGGPSEAFHENKQLNRKLNTPEDVLAALCDSSLSEFDHSSSDEEWIVTKANARTSSSQDDVYEKSSNSRSHNIPKSDNEIVSPLKLLRKPEYEVNKLPSGNKKSESAVSPIVIKRKKDSKKAIRSSLSAQPLTSSSKYNIADTENVVCLVHSPRKSSDILIRQESDTENEILTPKNKSTPQKRGSTRITTSSAKKKEIRKKNDLEDSFEEKISKLRIKDTPKKELPGEALKKMPEEIQDNLRETESKSSNDEDVLSKRIQRTPRRVKSQRKSVREDDLLSDQLQRSPRQGRIRKKIIDSDSEMESIVSPPKRKPTHESMDSGFSNLRRSSRQSTSQYKTLIISDSDIEDAKSPISKRKSNRTPKVSSHATKSASKSQSEQTIILNGKKENSDLEFSSPEMKKTPKRSVIKARESFVDSPSLRRQVLTPRKSARKKLDLSSPSSVKKVGSGFLSPVIHERFRRNSLGTPGSHIAETRASLHTSHVPSSLPCREKEFENVLKFLSRKIEDKAGGCMYISGVPGTGKTATVHAVVRNLQKKATTGDIPKFDFVEINALRLTEPRQAYTRIWQELSGEKMSADAAMKALEKKYTHNNRRPSVILVDELDYLCNRRQDVIYNILEWSTKSTAALSVITIANTMDLPERTLKGKVTSRMGLTRLVFQPYTFQQLQQIVMNRIGENSNFHVDAVQLVARKVAAVSGDARRALDVCRRATEMLTSDSDLIKVADIEKAISQIFAGTRVQAIKKCSVMSQYLLRAMRDEFQRTGVEESSVGQVYSQLSSICAFEGCEAPSVGVVLSLCTVLSDSGLILAEKCRTDLSRKLSLNVSADDIFYACNA